MAVQDQTAVDVAIIGAGPAGLTAAYLLTKKGYSVTVIEKDELYVGGISRTVEVDGYRFDIGGHRFFSKSKEVVDLWNEILPDDFIQRPRMASYVKAKAFPNKNVRSFQDWTVNQFGHKLFSIFFKTYTEKVWGMPCDEMSADWAAQRIFYVAVMLFLMVPGNFVVALLNVWPQLKPADDPRSDARLFSCQSAQSVATLSDLRRGQFLVPFNMAPMVLVQTAHSVLASGHHRNQKAMHDHIEILRSRPDVAKQLMAARGINYVALCPDEGGLDYYARKHPEGLWGQIAKGHVPDWLEPLPVKGKGIRVWRVR